MLDYHIQKNSRRCCVTGEALKPGDTFYTVLLIEDGKFVRQEHSAAAWSKPPENAFSYWTGKVPISDKEPRQVLDDEMLLECFIRLDGESEPEQVNFRYILALLLMRRRRLKFEEVIMREDQEILRLKNSKAKAHYEVINPNLTDEEISVVQEKVFEVLGW